MGHSTKIRCRTARTAPTCTSCWWTGARQMPARRSSHRPWTAPTAHPSWVVFLAVPSWTSCRRARTAPLCTAATANWPSSRGSTHKADKVRFLTVSTLPQAAVLRGRISLCGRVFNASSVAICRMKKWPVFFCLLRFHWMQGAQRLAEWADSIGWWSPLAPSKMETAGISSNVAIQMYYIASQFFQLSTWIKRNKSNHQRKMNKHERRESMDGTIYIRPRSHLHPPPLPSSKNVPSIWKLECTLEHMRKKQLTQVKNKTVTKYKFLVQKLMWT